MVSILLIEKIVTKRLASAVNESKISKTCSFRWKKTNELKNWRELTK